MHENDDAFEGPLVAAMATASYMEVGNSGSINFAYDLNKVINRRQSFHG